MPEAASSWFLPRVVGVQQAAEWVYTGRVFNAQEALAGRLVRSVHPADELLPAARALAAEIADNTAPVSVALSRLMMWRMLGADHPMEAHRVDSRAILARGRSDDAREGVTSFLEKRPGGVPRQGERRPARRSSRVGRPAQFTLATRALEATQRFWRSVKPSEMGSSTLRRRSSAATTSLKARMATVSFVAGRWGRHTARTAACCPP